MAKNLGALLGRQPNDYLAGVIPYEIRNPKGDWTDSLPPGEWQRNNYVDTMACVTFSLLNCIETQEFFLTGQRVNYSDRWIAKMSETTPNGNYLYKVANTVRHFGLVKEENWATPANFTWETYYADPDPATMQKLTAEGAEWLRTHDLAYEWLTTQLDDILKHIKQCPLQIVIPGHAIENFYEEKEVVHYFDSYNPFVKQTTRSKLADVLKPVLTIKGDPMLLYKFSDNPTEYVLTDDATLIGLASQAAVDKTLKGRAAKLIELPASQRLNFTIADSAIN